MIRGSLATVGRYGAVWEAEMIRDRLDAAGIQAFVQGSETGRSLSYVGVALGGVRVQVASQDLEAARQILREDAHQRLTAGDWRCARCEEPNDASFDLCWSCSLPRDAASAEAEEPAAQEEDASQTQHRLTDEPSAAPEDGGPTHFVGLLGNLELPPGFFVALIFSAILIAATITVLLNGVPR